MPIFGSGPKRTDGKTNFQINATPTYLTPTQVPNLAVWFDAADTSTLTTNISSLNIWYSKTNISSVMSNAFGLPGPIWRSTTQNGLPVVSFDGTNSSFMSSISMAYNATTFVTNNETTMLLAYNPTNNGVPFGVTTNSYGGDGIRLHPQSGQSWFFGNIFNTPNNARLDYSNVYAVNTGFKVESYFARAGTLGARTNGSLFSQSTMGTGLSFPAGTNYHVQMGGLSYGSRLFTQDIGEALIYNRGLSDYELRGVEAYLAKKWGTQNALPYQHPGRPTGAPLMGYRLALLGQISTLVASNAALWLDTYDANFLSSNFAPTFTPGSANPVNNAFVGAVIDKASQCNATSVPLRQPIYNLVGLNNYPTLTYVQGQPLNNRMPGTAPPYLGSSMSIFCVFNVASNSGTGYVASVSDQQGAPTNLGIGIYYNSNNRTIGINRANTVFTTPYTLQSNLLLSAFVNGTPSTIGGLVPSTMSMNINGAQTNMSSLGSLLSSFSTPYYTMGGVYNGGATNTSISEFIVYYRTLGTNERTALESQLIKKWGLVSNAPVSYINSLPVTNGLYTWVDAYSSSNISTTVTSDGLTRVDTAFDRSGNSNNFKIYSGWSNVFYNRVSTMNSMNSLYFSTGTYNGTLSNVVPINTFSTNSYSFFMVYNQLSTNTLSRLIAANNQTGSDAAVGGFSYQILNQTPYFTPYQYQFAGANIVNGTNYLTSVIVNGGPTYETFLTSTFSVYTNSGTGPALTSAINGASTNLLNLSQINIGGRPFSLDFGFNGLISEFMIYNRALSNAERQSVESYLINKWNISTLVSNVPVTRGLNLWLDAYDPDTMIFSTNTNLVRQWRDKSISTLHFSNTLTSAFVRPPTYTTNPVNSLPGLLFSNSASIYGTGIYNCNFNYPVTKEATIFTVAQWSSGNASYYSPVFCMLSNNEIVNTTGNSFTVVGPGNGTTVGLYRSTPGLLGSIGNTLDKPTLLSGVFNSSFSTTLIVDIPQNNMAIGRNGVIGATQISSFISTLGNGALSTTNFNVNQAVLGLRAPSGGDATWFHSGYIHEVLLYNRTLTFNERQQVESYLLSKWRI